MSQKFTHVGENYRGFTVKQSVWIEEIQCQYIELLHEKSQLRVVHLQTDEEENTFAILLETIPEDSSGVAHILEHTVLTGSKNYPVRDPFFSMLKRTLSTFMNAFTGQDWTCYPFASCNEVDYFNLMGIYLDACFHPTLSYLNFCQEGWHLAFEGSGPAGPLEYRGVVYNEMQAANQAPTTILFNETFKELFPNLCYRHISGGDPQEIPTLTYEALLKFHKEYYHPSRAIICTSGNGDLSSRLDRILEEGVCDQPPLPPYKRQNRQPRFTAPKSLRKSYPVEKLEEGASYLGITWLTYGIDEPEKLLALNLLDSILMDNDASLLKKQILETKLCKNIESDFEDDMSDAPYMLVCMGCNADKCHDLEQAIYSALEKIADSEIPSELIEAAMHTLTIDRLEITGSSFPYGLNLMFRSAFYGLYNEDMKGSLKINEQLDHLAKRVREKGFLQQMIREIFLENRHRVTLRLDPDLEMAKRSKRQLEEKLASVKEKLTEEQVLTIQENVRQIQELQEKDESEEIAKLPKIERQDLDPKSKAYALTGNGPIRRHTCFTNNMLYADLHYPLPKLAFKDLQPLQVLLSMSNELGTAKNTWSDYLHKVQMSTGGLSISTSFATHVDPEHPLVATLNVSSKALAKNQSAMFSLMRERIEEIDLSDRSRIHELITQYSSLMQQSLQRSALRFASLYAASSMTPANFIAAEMRGFNYYFFLKRLASNLDAGLCSLLELMQPLKEKILHANNPELVITCGEDDLKVDPIPLFVDISTRSYTPWSNTDETPTLPWKGFTLPMTIVFNVYVIPTLRIGHPLSPAMTALGYLLEHLELHTRIREQGGAYGASGTHNPLLGTFTFRSWRDPNVASTLIHFKESIEVIASGKFTQSDLDDAVLGCIRDADQPVMPGMRGSARYAQDCTGLTPAIRQNNRQEILSLTRPKLIEAANSLLESFPLGTFATIGDIHKIEKDRKRIEGLFQHDLEIENIY